MGKQYLFDSATYSARRKTLAEKIGSGVILLFGNRTSPINYADNYYPFRQHSCFLYYAGLDLPNLNLVIDIDKGETILFAQARRGEDVQTEPSAFSSVQGGIPSVKTCACPHQRIAHYKHMQEKRTSVRSHAPHTD